jgi:hypothetical protein
MSNAATIEPPAFEALDESAWVVVEDPGPIAAPARLETRGSGRDRHYLIPRGHLKLAGRDTVQLPSADDLD